MTSQLIAAQFRHSNTSPRTEVCTQTMLYSILSLTDVSLMLLCLFWPFTFIYRCTPMNIRIKTTLQQQQLDIFKCNCSGRQKSLRGFVLLQFTVCCAEGCNTFLFQQQLVVCLYSYKIIILCDCFLQGCNKKHFYKLMIN